MPEKEHMKPCFLSKYPFFNKLDKENSRAADAAGKTGFPAFLKVSGFR
jgi:hypothetical protein